MFVVILTSFLVLCDAFDLSTASIRICIRLPNKPSMRRGSILPNTLKLMNTNYSSNDSTSGKKKTLEHDSVANKQNIENAAKIAVIVIGCLALTAVMLVCCGICVFICYTRGERGRMFGVLHQLILPSDEISPNNEKDLKPKIPKTTKQEDELKIDFLSISKSFQQKTRSKSSGNNSERRVGRASLSYGSSDKKESSESETQISSPFDRSREGQETVDAEFLELKVQEGAQSNMKDKE